MPVVRAQTQPDKGLGSSPYITATSHMTAGKYLYLTPDLHAVSSIQTEIRDRDQKGKFVTPCEVPDRWDTREAAVAIMNTKAKQ